MVHSLRQSGGRVNYFLGLHVLLSDAILQWLGALDGL